MSLASRAPPDAFSIVTVPTVLGSLDTCPSHLSELQNKAKKSLWHFKILCTKSRGMQRRR